jgi:replicative DNA helicase
MNCITDYPKKTTMIESLERILLCAMTLNRQNFEWAVSTGLSQDHFLLEELAARAFENIPIPFNEDIVSAAAKLDEAGIKQYARFVIHAHQRRNIASLLQKAKIAHQNDQPVGEILDQIELFENNDNAKPEIVSAQEALINACFNLTSKQQKPDFIRFGIPVLDQSIFLEPGNLALLVSRPGNGKSALALWLSENVARQDKKVLFVSLELTENELSLRLAARLLHKNYASLRLQATQQEIQYLHQAANRLPSQLLFCCNAHSSRQIEYLVKNHSPDLLVIDYIGLVEYQNIQEDTPRVSALSRWAKRTAMKYNTAVLVLHQLNRETEIRNGSAIKMRHIRDTGQLEQDASLIMAIYPKNEEEMPPPPRREMIFDVIKNRNAQLRRLPFVFNMPFMDFSFPEPAPQKLTTPALQIT